MSSWAKFPRLYTWSEAEKSAFEKFTWEYSLISLPSDSAFSMIAPYVPQTQTKFLFLKDWTCVDNVCLPLPPGYPKIRDKALMT